ncbi:MAG TPA: hypothetical protein VHJ00_13440, partial [Bradyrhizobium sp.]|nr:hypothetical protein [Bradyrhizobium sp.]
MVDRPSRRRQLAACVWDFTVAAIDQPATAMPGGLLARLKAKLAGGPSEASVTRRLAGTIFIIRVLSAAM